jgi:hypothetical protein
MMMVMTMMMIKMMIMVIIMIISELNIVPPEIKIETSHQEQHLSDPIVWSSMFQFPDTCNFTNTGSLKEQLVIRDHPQTKK